MKMFEPRSFLQKMTDPWVGARLVGWKGGTAHLTPMQRNAWPTGRAMHVPAHFLPSMPSASAVSSCTHFWVVLTERCFHANLTHSLHAPHRSDAGVPPLPHAGGAEQRPPAAPAVGGDLLHGRCVRACAPPPRFRCFPRRRLAAPRDRPLRATRCPCHGSLAGRGHLPPIVVLLLRHRHCRCCPAGFHLVFARWAKPFNPVLGETWQAALPDGSAIALEQISHHPPITAFQMQGPRSPGGAPTYTFTGHSQPCVSFKPSSTAVKTTARGFRVLDFADGGRIEVHFPAYYLKGLLYNSGLRGEVTGTAEFVDVQHGLRAVVCFGRVEAGQTATLRRSDAFSGCVYRSRLPPPQQQQQQQQPALGRDSAVSSSSTSSSGWQRPTTTSTSEMVRWACPPPMHVSCDIHSLRHTLLHPAFVLPATAGQAQGQQQR